MQLKISNSLKITFLLVISTALIWFLEHKIATDLRFHYGKDGGAFVRFESIIFLSLLFHLLMGNNHFLIKLIIGALIGIVAGILGYLVSFYLFEWDFPFQYISLVFMMTLYYLISKIRNQRTLSKKS